MLPRNMLRIKRALAAPSIGGSFAAGTTARFGDILQYEEGAQKSRYLGFVITADGPASNATTGPVAGLTTLSIGVQGSPDEGATTGSTWEDLTTYGTTTPLQFPNEAMAGSTAALNDGSVFGTVDLGKSEYKSHRLKVTAVSGSTSGVGLQAAAVFLGEHELEPDDIQADQLIELQHFSD